MTEQDTAEELTVGPYRGVVLAPYAADDALLGELAGLRARLAQPGTARVSPGPDRVYRVELTGAAGPLCAAIKVFDRQSLLKDMSDRARGSGAARSLRMATILRERGVGTPEPIAYLDRWQGRRLRESYLLTRFEEGISSFRDELAALYVREPEAEKILGLLACVARAVRAMHDAGVLHRDLGNQNILLRRRAAAQWQDVQFVDLNRARLRGRPSLRERAADLSRISLPSDFLRIFKDMYFEPVPPPAAFQRFERRYRAAFAWHTRTRRWRRPIRTARRRREGHGRPCYPAPREIWVWDERSGQAISTMRRKERSAQYPAANFARLALATGLGLPDVWRRYRALRRTCFTAPVRMAQRIGLALHPTATTAERELDLLARLGAPPVLLRLYHHRPKSETRATLALLRELRRRGCPVSVAFVQDRRAVREPASWRDFVEETAEPIVGEVQRMEVGHAINRVKWGLWDIAEYRRLVAPFVALKERHPDLRLAGPAVIDFEYPFAMAALRSLPAGCSFDALSLHLYVDRRGAPENRQGPFDTTAKCALARAMAGWCPNCEDRLVISEVNWPLQGTGVYSPVGSPYVSPGPRRNDPSVSEEDYGNFMIRYFLLSICSGMAEQVYWWRLVARGYGLVDDTEPDAWRERPAYAMLRAFFELLGQSTFRSRLASPRGVHLYAFDRPDGEQLVLGYSEENERLFELPFSFDSVQDRVGQRVAVQGQAVRLSGAPLYFRAVRA